MMMFRNKLSHQPLPLECAFYVALMDDRIAITGRNNDTGNGFFSNKTTGSGKNPTAGIEIEFDDEPVLNVASGFCSFAMSMRVKIW